MMGVGILGYKISRKNVPDRGDKSGGSAGGTPDTGGVLMAERESPRK